MTDQAVEEVEEVVLSDEDFERRLKIITKRQRRCQKMLLDIWDNAHFNPANRPEDGSRLPYREYIEMREYYYEKKALSEEFRDQTAWLHVSLEQDYPDRFTVREWPDGDVGDAKRIPVSYPPNTKEWTAARVNTVGGSDFGTLVAHYFDDDGWGNFEGVEEVKIYGNDLDELPWAHEEAGLLGPQEGPLFRGNAYEQSIAKSFEHEYGHLYDVFITKDQFKNVHRPWQQLNFDGILIEKQTGSRGILEIKNVTELDFDYIDEMLDSAEENGGFAHRDYIPTTYRGQVLYYLNGTNSDFGIIRMRYNDSIVIDYKLHRDDPIHRSTDDMNVDQFVQGPLRRYYMKWKLARRKLGITPKSLLEEQRLQELEDGQEA